MLDLNRQQIDQLVNAVAARLAGGQLSQGTGAISAGPAMPVVMPSAIASTSASGVAYPTLDQAVAAAIVVHAIAFLPVVLLGVVFMAQDGLSFGRLQAMAGSAREQEQEAKTVR
jgi:hypothetical protein